MAWEGVTYKRLEGVRAIHPFYELTYKMLAKVAQWVKEGEQATLAETGQDQALFWKGRPWRREGRTGLIIGHYPHRRV